jgi:predicted transposase/invertase (TIGR01784 family)
VNYIARVLERYFPEDAVTGKEGIKLRLIILYTGEVDHAEPNLEVDCLTLRTESVFLNKIDGDKEFAIFKNKIENNLSLNNEEIMRTIILPLTQKGTEKKQEMLEQVVETAMEIQDEKLQLMIMSSVLVASDKFISEEYSTRIRRYLNMTKIERIFEKEKIEYANERVREAVTEAVRDRTIDIARTMMRRGTDILLIMEATGLSEHEIMNLQDKSATA